MEKNVLEILYEKAKFPYDLAVVVFVEKMLNGE